MRIFSVIILCICWLSVPRTVFSGGQITDQEKPIGEGYVLSSKNYVHREFAEETIERLNNEKDLRYPVSLAENKGWLGPVYRFLYMIFSWIGDLFGVSVRNIDNILNVLYFLSSCLILYLLYKLFGARYSWVFGKEGRAMAVPFRVEEEDIHTIDFEKEINKAAADRQYRLAVRLVYLHTLKALSDKQVIKWAPARTNREYLQEIQKETIRAGFNSLCYYFNYVWYGDFQASEDTFEQVKSDFNNISKELNS